MAGPLSYYSRKFGISQHHMYRVIISHAQNRCESLAFDFSPPATQFHSTQWNLSSQKAKTELLSFKKFQIDVLKSFASSSSKYLNRFKTDSTISRHRSLSRSHKNIMKHQKNDYSETINCKATIRNNFDEMFHCLLIKWVMGGGKNKRQAFATVLSMEISTDPNE